jgi:hypothetical protein
MASIVPQESDSGDPKFLNYFSSPSAPKPDQAGENLTKGIASLFESSVTGFDKMFEKKAVDQVKDIAKSADELFGNNAAVKTVAEGSNPTDVLGDVNAQGEGVLGLGGRGSKGAPPGVDKLGAKISSLEEAYRNGDLSNSKYQAYVEMETRKAIANYPEYEDKIRAEVRTRLGGSPDQLRKQLVADLDAKYRSANTEANKIFTFITSPSNQTAFGSYPGGPEKVIQEYLEGGHKDPAWISKVIGIATRFHARKGAFDSSNAEIDYLEKNTKYAAEQFERGYGDYIRGHVNETLNNLLDDPKIKEFLDKAKADPKSVTADDITAAKSLFSVYEQKIAKELNDMSAGYNPGTRDPISIAMPDGRTPASILGNKLKEVHSSAWETFKAMKGAVDGGKFDLVSTIKDHSEISLDINKSHMLDQSQELKNIATLEKLSPDLLKTMVNSQNYVKDIRDKYLAAGTRSFLMNITAPQATPPPSLTDAMQPDKKLTPTENKSLAAAKYNGAVSVLLDPNNTGETFLRSAKAVYGPGNEKFMTNIDNPTRVYVQMTSDAFTKKMLAHANQDPELLQNYFNWSSRFLPKALQGPIETMSNAIQNDPRLEFQWDAGTMQMSITNTAAAKLGGRIPDEVKNTQFMVNAAVKQMKAIAEASGQPTVSIYDSLRAAGMNVSEAEKANETKTPTDFDARNKLGMKTIVDKWGQNIDTAVTATKDVADSISQRVKTFQPTQRAQTPDTPMGFTSEQFEAAKKEYPDARIDRQGRLVVNVNGKWHQIKPK